MKHPEIVGLLHETLIVFIWSFWRCCRHTINDFILCQLLIHQSTRRGIATECNYSPIKLQGYFFSEAILGNSCFTSLSGDLTPPSDESEVLSWMNHHHEWWIAFNSLAGLCGHNSTKEVPARKIRGEETLGDAEFGFDWYKRFDWCQRHVLQVLVEQVMDIDIIHSKYSSETNVCTNWDGKSIVNSKIVLLSTLRAVFRCP